MPEEGLGYCHFCSEKGLEKRLDKAHQEFMLRRTNAAPSLSPHRFVFVLLVVFVATVIRTLGDAAFAQEQNQTPLPIMAPQYVTLDMPPGCQQDGSFVHCTIPKGGDLDIPAQAGIYEAGNTAIKKCSGSVYVSEGPQPMPNPSASPGADNFGSTSLTLTNGETVSAGGGGDGCGAHIQGSVHIHVPTSVPDHEQFVFFYGAAYKLFDSNGPTGPAVYSTTFAPPLYTTYTIDVGPAIIIARRPKRSSTLEENVVMEGDMYFSPYKTTLIYDGTSLNSQKLYARATASHRLVASNANMVRAGASTSLPGVTPQAPRVKGDEGNDGEVLITNYLDALLSSFGSSGCKARIFIRMGGPVYKTEEGLVIIKTGRVLMQGGGDCWSDAIAKIFAKINAYEFNDRVNIKNVQSVDLGPCIVYRTILAKTACRTKQIQVPVVLERAAIEQIQVEATTARRGIGNPELSLSPKIYVNDKGFGYPLFNARPLYYRGNFVENDGIPMGYVPFPPSSMRFINCRKENRTAACSERKSGFPRVIAEHYQSEGWVTNAGIVEKDAMLAAHHILPLSVGGKNSAVNGVFLPNEKAAFDVHNVFTQWWRNVTIPLEPITTSSPSPLR